MTDSFTRTTFICEYTAKFIPAGKWKPLMTHVCPPEKLWWTSKSPWNGFERYRGQNFEIFVDPMISVKFPVLEPTHSRQGGKRIKRETIQAPLLRVLHNTLWTCFLLRHYNCLVSEYFYYDRIHWDQFIYSCKAQFVFFVKFIWLRWPAE